MFSPGNKIAVTETSNLWFGLSFRVRHYLGYIDLYNESCKHYNVCIGGKKYKPKLF